MGRLLDIDPADISRYAAGKAIAPAYQAKLKHWEKRGGKWFKVFEK